MRCYSSTFISITEEHEYELGKRPRGAAIGTVYSTAFSSNWEQTGTTTILEKLGA